MATFPAKFDSTCRGCDEAITAGDPITWTAEGGPRCEACGPHQPDEARGPKTASEDAPGYVRVLARRCDALAKRLDGAAAALRYFQAWAERVGEDLNIAGPECEEEVIRAGGD